MPGAPALDPTLFSQSQSFGILQKHIIVLHVLKLSKKNLTHKIVGRRSDEMKIIFGRPKSI